MSTPEPMDRVRPGLVAPLPLAQGTLEARDARELEELKDLIRVSMGFYSQGYKEKCLRRRLAVRMRARGLHRYGEYGELLRTDADELERLRATLTINVTKFFRNNEVWQSIGATVLPPLFELDVPEIRIWSAGCASGEEPYTLAILLREHAERHGRLRDLERFRIVGTDIDVGSLAAAALAEFPPLAVSETSPERLARWFTASGARHRLDPRIRAMVEFRRHDLLLDEPEPGWHLIACRNVIIYFERDVQDALFERFRAALAPGGTLLLGKVETLFGPASRGLETVAGANRIYRRP